MAEEVTSIKWHPGFCSAMELEFLQYKDLLDFNREFPLSKEPLRIDLLMIKKIKDVVLDIDIGRLFKTYNIIEYKSPKDGLTIDDYIKTVGYAYLYKGLGATVDAVPLSELTATIVRDTEPTELFKKIQSEGGSIEEKFPGRLEKARLLTRALENLLILKDKEGVFEVDWKRAKSFAQMDAQSQAMYLLSSVSARYSRTKTKFYSQVFLDALKSVPAKGFKSGAFLRCVYLLCCKDSGQEESFVGSQSRFARIIQSHRQEEADLRGNSNGAFFERMLEQAEVFGFALFEDAGESVNGEKIVYKNPRFFESRVPPKNIAMVNVDSGFSLTLMPGFGLARVLEIAVFSDLVKFDTVVQFEINQSSAIRAFDQGLGAEQIINILKDNSNFAVPEALEFSIKEWEANYKSICVYKGFVLKVSQERSEALLHNPNLKKRVLERLAPQVFLLDCKDEDEVAALLKNCGVENIGKIKGAEDEPELTGFVPLKGGR